MRLDPNPTHHDRTSWRLQLFGSIRRVAGSVSLLLALIMLLCGQTVFLERLKGLPFLLYWFFCSLLTLIAVGAAWFEMRFIKKNSALLQRELLAEAMNDVEASKVPDPPQTQ